MLLNEADAVYLGGVAQDAVFLGGTKVWPPDYPVLGYQEGRFTRPSEYSSMQFPVTLKGDNVYLFVVFDGHCTWHGDGETTGMSYTEGETCRWYQVLFKVTDMHPTWQPTVPGARLVRWIAVKTNRPPSLISARYTERSIDTVVSAPVTQHHALINFATDGPTEWGPIQGSPVFTDAPYEPDPGPSASLEWHTRVPARSGNRAPGLELIGTAIALEFG